MQQTVGHIPDVYEIAFEFLFEENEVAFFHGGIHEVIDEQIEPHSWGKAENRGESKSNRVGRVNQELLGIDLGAAIERDGFEGGLLREEGSAGGGAVAAIGIGKKNELLATAEAIEKPHGFEIDARRQRRITIAGRGADNCRQVNHNVRVRKNAFHERFVANVALDEVEMRVRTEVIKPLLPGAVHEIVEGRNAESGIEQVLAENAADVAEPAGHEDAFHANELRNTIVGTASVDRAGTVGQDGSRLDG